MAEPTPRLRSTDRGDRRARPGEQRPEPVAVLAADLPGAMTRGDIGVRFQPQVRLADDRVTGVEALARWDHPLLGPVHPDQLFAAAARAGTGAALSGHVQQLALGEAAGWPEGLRTLDLSINVTAADIASERFAEAVLARVAASGIEARRICVEVTESAPIADLARAASALRRLRDAGVRVAIDDFGAGHAGIGWLKALPFDRLKLDRSLVAEVTEERGRALVQGVLALARALGLGTVAEGVETEVQRQVLAAEGCGWYQGFLCAGALDTPALIALVEERA